MAYEIQQDEDEAGEGQVALGQQVGGLIQSEGSSASAPAGKASQKSSGAFTNIQNYLNVNQDQAEPLAQKTVAPIQQKAQEAVAGATAAKGEFQNQVQAAQTKDNEALLKSLTPEKKAPKPANSPAPSIGNLPPHLTFVADEPAYDSVGSVDGASQAKDPRMLSESERQDLQKALQAKYEGPESIQDLEGFNQARAKAQEAEHLGNLTQSEGGRFELLRKVVNGPQYTRGQNRLDQAILAQSDPARQTLSNVRSQTSGLGNQVGQIESESNALVAPMKQALEANKQKTQQGLQAALQNRLYNIDSQAQTLNNQKAATEAQIRKQITEITTGKLDPSKPGFAEAYSLLTGSSFPTQVGVEGGAVEYFDPTYFSIPADSFIQSGTNASRESVATEQDRLQIEALADLMGTQEQYFQPGEAPAFDGNVRFDTGAYRNKVMKNLGEYQNESQIDDFIKARQDDPVLGYQDNLGRIDRLTGIIEKDIAPNDYDSLRNGKAFLDRSGLTHGRVDFNAQISDYLNQIREENVLRQRLGLKPLEMPSSIDTSNPNVRGEYLTKFGQIRDALTRSLLEQQNVFNPEVQKNYFGKF